MFLWSTQNWYRHRDYWKGLLQFTAPLNLEEIGELRQKKFAFFVSTHSSYVTLSAVTSLSRKILERRGIGIYVLLAPFSDFAGFFFFFFFHPTAFYSETFIPFSELTEETRSKAHRKIRKPYSHTVVQCLVQDWS